MTNQFCSGIIWNYEKQKLSDVGGKSFWLSEVKKRRIKTPRWFTVTTKSCEELLLASSKIETGIAISLKKLKSPFAIRSSSVLEDLKSASFAGMYETFLNISVGGVLDSIKACLKSAFSPRVLAYLEKMGISGSNKMAVMVQEMIFAKTSGVILTIDPRNGDPSKIWIEHSRKASPTSGEETPNFLLVDKLTGSIDIINGITMDEKIIKRLSFLGKKIERAFRCYQDIEWLIDEKNNIFILQARPETIWNKKI